MLQTLFNFIHMPNRILCNSFSSYRCKAIARITKRNACVWLVSFQNPFFDRMDYRIHLSNYDLIARISHIEWRWYRYTSDTRTFDKIRTFKN